MRILACLILAPCCALAVSRPVTLISDDEAEPLRSAITRREAWTQDAARRLRAEADRRLTQGPWSVTSDRPPGFAPDPHDYYSEAPYWWPNPDDPVGPYILRDGRINPERFTANRNSLNQMCDSVLTLGAAAYLFDDVRYAQKAERLLQVWFLNAKTRMNPNLDYAQAIRGINGGRAAGVVDTRCMVRAIVGMEFLVRTGDWDSRDQGAIHKWLEEYLRWLTQTRNGLDEKNGGVNESAWWTAQVSTVAAFLQDEAVLKASFQFYREHVFPRQVHLDSVAWREEVRNSPGSFVFHLEALTIICRVAAQQGVDLWGLRGADGSAMGGLVDSVQHYVADPHRWSREQTADLESDGLYFLAFAGMGLKRPEYLDLYQKLEHPDHAWLNLVDLLVGRWEAAGHQTRH